jgi:hypothetical protein
VEGRLCCRSSQNLNIDQPESFSRGINSWWSHTISCLTPTFALQGSVYTVIQPLIWLFSNSNHELYQFEAGLGLTNIASMNSEVRNTIVMNGAWHELTHLLASENEQVGESEYFCILCRLILQLRQVQRAGIECLANLVMCDKSFEHLRKDGMQDIKLFLMFSKAEDIKMKLAATGGLAMMTQVGTPLSHACLCADSFFFPTGSSNSKEG